MGQYSSSPSNPLDNRIPTRQQSSGIHSTMRESATSSNNSLSVSDFNSSIDTTSATLRSPVTAIGNKTLSNSEDQNRESSSRSQNAFSSISSSGSSSTENTSDCGNSSNSASSRSRRISRHLTSLGLMQQSVHHQENHHLHSRSTNPSISATSVVGGVDRSLEPSTQNERAYSSLEPFTRRIESEDGSLQNTSSYSSGNSTGQSSGPSSRISQSRSHSPRRVHSGSVRDGYRIIPTSTSRVLGTLSSGVTSSSSTVPSTLSKRRNNSLTAAPSDSASSSSSNGESQRSSILNGSFLRNRFSRMRSSLSNSSSQPSSITSSPSRRNGPPPPPPVPTEPPIRSSRYSTDILSPFVSSSPDQPSSDDDNVNAEISEPSTASGTNRVDSSLRPEPTYFRRRPRPHTATDTTNALATGLTPLPLFSHSASSAQASSLATSLTSGTRNNFSSQSTTRSRHTSRTRSWRDTDSARDLTNAISSDTTTRLRPGEDQAAMLSRLLSIAAAATAASLVGNTNESFLSSSSPLSSQNSADSNGTENDQPVSDDERDGLVDGSFDGFLRALQNGRLAAELRNESNNNNNNNNNNSNNNNNNNNNSNSSNTDGENNEQRPALNFFRMFRFGASENNSGSGSRMVPVIIVGIRSISAQSSVNGSGANANDPSTPFLDSLPISTAMGGSTFGGLSSERPSRRRRRSEASEATSLNNDRRRRPLGLSSLFPEFNSGDTNSHDSDDDLDLNEVLEYGEDSDMDVDVEEGDDRSTRSSDRLWSRRSSLRSTLSHLNGDINDVDNNDHLDDETITSENNRRFGHSAHRHSHSHSSAATTDGSTREGSNGSNGGNMRSWIIYVLGGSYPENHPILTTPSLFTDSPTYEDMLLLSSFIGPAKPPVATQQDVERSGGEFIANDDHVSEKCLVCLSEFEKNESCRKLKGCGHMFHKACIDEWLTTGRNSCPLCRAVGVLESNEDSSSLLSTSMSQPAEQNAPETTASVTDLDAIE
ncbi:hypothetical protein V1511DRAFT_510600 [Dipodascopsis uninucleata]